MDANEQAQTLESAADSARTDDDAVDLFSPDYHKVCCLVEAADCEGVLETGMAGIELLIMRSDKQEKPRDKVERTTLSKQMRKGWDYSIHSEQTEEGECQPPTINSKVKAADTAHGHAITGKEISILRH